MEGDMMKIAHICTSISYVIMKSYIRFINEEFNSENHDFIVIGENKEINSLIFRAMINS